MGESPRHTDAAGPPAAVTDRDELTDDERADAAARAERLVAATLDVLHEQTESGE